MDTRAVDSLHIVLLAKAAQTPKKKKLIDYILGKGSFKSFQQANAYGNLEW